MKASAAGNVTIVSFLLKKRAVVNARSAVSTLRRFVHDMASNFRRRLCLLPSCSYLLP